MDAVKNLLSRYGWERRPDLENELRPAVFSFGTWKCIVGGLWTTVWRLVSEGHIDELDSYRTDDLKAVEAALKAAT